MKKVFILVTAATLVACSGGSDSADLGLLKAERDSLSGVSQNIAKRIQEIDAQLAVLDSSRVLTAVTTVKISSESFVHSFESLGKVEADRSVNLLPETPGLIKRVLVQEGDRVSAGQVLIQLDHQVISSTREEVKKSLSLATTLFEKQTRLWNQGIGSEVQYLQAKTNKELLEQRIATLQSQWNMSQIKAPFAGTVDDITAKTGEFASPGMPLARLISAGKTTVTANVPESYALVVNKGQNVDLFFPTLNKTVEAKVIQVGEFIHPDSRTFQVHIALPSGDFKPNMLAKVRIRDYEASNVLSIPTRLIQQNAKGENYVFVYRWVKKDIGLVERMQVELGTNNGSVTEIKSGVKEGEILIDKGSRNVQEGQTVKNVVPQLP